MRHGRTEEEGHDRGRAVANRPRGWERSPQLGEEAEKPLKWVRAAQERHPVVRPQRQGCGTPLSHKGEWRMAQTPRREDSILQWRHAVEGSQRWGRGLKSVAWQSSQQH